MVGLKKHKRKKEKFKRGHLLVQGKLISSTYTVKSYWECQKHHWSLSFSPNVIKQGFVPWRRSKKEKEGEKWMGALVHHRKPATSSTTKQWAQNNMLSLKLSSSPTARGKRREWAEEERVAGQTVRGKGSKGAWLPGWGGPAAPTMSTSSVRLRARPRRGALPVRLEVSGMDKRKRNSPTLAEQLGSGHRSLGLEKRCVCVLDLCHWTNISAIRWVHRRFLLWAIFAQTNLL